MAKIVGPQTSSKNQRVKGNPSLRRILHPRSANHALLGQVQPLDLCQHHAHIWKVLKKLADGEAISAGDKTAAATW